MNIGVVAYINPIEFKNYFDNTTILPNINKGASSVNNITLGFLKAGHHVTIITTTPEGKVTKHFYGENIAIHIIPTYNPIPKSYVFEKYYMVNRIKRELALHINSMDVIHTHWTYDFALACCFFANKKPVFCSIRDWAPIIRHYERKHRKILWWLIQEQLFHKVMSHTNVNFIANSPYIFELMKKNYPQNKCTIIENPIKRSFILEKRNRYPKNPIVISISQDLIEKRKNYTNLLLAFKLYLKNHNKQAKLILIGNYNKNSKLYKEWCKRQLLKNVEMPGFVDHDNLIKQLDSASVLIHPSLEESFGNTLLEGMARRIPVIGGNQSGAIPYVLGHGKYGILCNVNTPKDIEEAIDKATRIEQNKECINNATKYLMDNLNEENISSKHIILFKEALGYNNQETKDI